MDSEVAAEFAQVAADAKPYKRGHLQVAAGVIKSHVDQLFTRQGRAKWQIPSMARGAAQGQTEKPILSEENKDDLKVIVAALISDMMPALQRLVAKDPRIQRFSLSNSPRFKELIIKEYKVQLAARRKSQIALLRAASTLAQNNVSTQAYRAIRSILVEMGFRNVMPTEGDLSKARATIEECANIDLALYATADGWFASPTAVIEIDLTRRLQMTSAKNSRKESGARVIGLSGPGMHGWQDKRTVKFTLDARTVTRKTSHTEMSAQVFDEGKAGEADSHRALGLRTLGIWMGKDSREKVRLNATPVFEEFQQLAENGLVFNRVLQTFLGQAEAFRKLPENEQQAVCEDGGKKYCPVKINFIFGGDMAAQCAVFGHGCAGNHYCGHCMAHEEDRHLPYVLVTTDEKISLQAMAHKYDMHARTLYAINTRQDHRKVQILTDEGLRNSTAMDAAAREAAARADMEREVEAGHGARRAKKRARKVPIANSEPDEAVLKSLVGWKENHPLQCSCVRCVVPKGTCVRVIPVFGFSRPSDYLKEHFPALTAEMCPFCVLHCNMRVTETLFYQICQAALTSSRSKKLIEGMNAALHDLGINRSYKESLVTGKYEKVTFEGHQAWDLLKTGSDGRMGIERVLDAMWPGAAEDKGVGTAYGTKFVPRTIEVWRQWAVVVKLMSERFSEKLLKDVVDGEDGFARFGKECREFIFRFQSMSTVDYSKSYYLHTLLHHAGDFMRALQKEGLTLGMMSNSGAERRHEYGRRASRKALASNGWRKKKPEYANRPNLMVYVTMKEIQMFEYGKELVSHEMARLCAAGNSPEAGPLQPRCAAVFNIKPRRVLLSEEELHSEFEAGPDAPPPSFETSNKKIWGERGKKNALAMIAVQIEDDSDEEPEGSDKGVKSFDPDDQHELVDGQPVYVTDDGESVAGSEEDMEDFHGGLTMGSFDFPEQDEDEDEDYAFQNGAAERDLAREPYEWVWEKEGETGPDVHDGSDQPVKRTTYPRGKNPTTQAAAEPVATGSRLLQPEPVQPAGFEFVGSTVKVCAQQVQPAGFVFVGSALDMLCADSGGRRPAPAAKRPVRGQQDRGQGQRGAGRERGGKRGQAPGARGKGQETALSFS
jgi:hypothetical protein